MKSQCTFIKNLITESVRFLLSSLGKKGQFIFIIRFASAYNQSDYPVEVKLRQYLYFQASVKSKDKTLSALAENCYATPAQDRNHATKYYILKDGLVLKLVSSSQSNNFLRYFNSLGVSKWRIRRYWAPTWQCNSIIYYFLSCTDDFTCVTKWYKLEYWFRLYSTQSTRY